MFKIFSTELLNANIHLNFASSTPGTYTIKVPARVKALITLVGGGGISGKLESQLWGQEGQWWFWSGNSGACFKAEVFLQKGTYTVTVGGSGGASVFASNSQGTLVSVAAGTDPLSDANGATVTVYSNLDVYSIQMQQTGNVGNSGVSASPYALTGAASVYGGYGKGADFPNGTPGNGYVEIIY